MNFCRTDEIEKDFSMDWLRMGVDGLAIVRKVLYICQLNTHAMGGEGEEEGPSTG